MRDHSVFPRGIVSAGLVLALIGLAAQAQAATYHVNNQVACSDEGPGTPTQPWCTFKKGVTAIRSGDTLNVYEGVYRVTDDILNIPSSMSTRSSSSTG
jgi:hypothetical protein